MTQRQQFFRSSAKHAGRNEGQIRGGRGALEQVATALEHIGYHKSAYGAHPP